MAAYKARRKRSAGLKAISGMRTKGAMKPTKTTGSFETPSGAPSPSMLGRYSPRSAQADMPARARGRRGSRKLF